MKKLTSLHHLHWLISKFANLLILLLIFAGCSKDKNQPEAPATTQVNRDEVKEYIQLTTQKSSVTLRIEAAKEDEKAVWIDLNGNNKWEEGIDIAVTNFGEETYSLKANTFRIYGKVSLLKCDGNDISAIALHNPYLEDFRASGNKLQSLNIPDNDNLRILYIDFNPLSSLTLGKLPHLKVLGLETTLLSTLALGGYPNLEELVVSSTPITQLNVSANTKLNRVGIGRHNGEGLIGAALKAFAESLHSNGGEIFLSDDQKTPEILGILGGKKWRVQ